MGRIKKVYQLDLFKEKTRIYNKFEFPYDGIGNWAMKAFLEYLIKYKKGLSKKQRLVLLSKVEKCCTIECIRDQTMRPRLLKGIEKVGSPDPQRYFNEYSRRHYARAMKRKNNGKTSEGTRRKT